MNQELVFCIGIILGGVIGIALSVLVPPPWRKRKR